MFRMVCSRSRMALCYEVLPFPESGLEALLILPEYIGASDVDIIAFDVFPLKSPKLGSDHAGEDHDFRDGAVMFFEVVKELKPVRKTYDGVLFLLCLRKLLFEIIKRTFGNFLPSLRVPSTATRFRFYLKIAEPCNFYSSPLSRVAFRVSKKHSTTSPALFFVIPVEF